MEVIVGILASQLAMGVLVGFLIGFAMKKITKIALALACVFFLTLAYLEYSNFIAVNYEAVALAVNDLLQKIGAKLVIPAFIASNLPILISFGGAMVLGFKKG
jgi:uncharacterized membrane protein (Fun14 family)